MLFFLLWMQGRKGRMGKNVFWWEVEENFFFSWGKCLKESAFLMKKSIEMGRKGLFFCGGYITIWLKVAQSGFLWWKATAKV